MFTSTINSDGEIKAQRLLEIKERLANSLSYIENKGGYDLRLNHFNAAVWGELEQGCLLYAEEQCTEEDLLVLIKQYRDLSQVGYLDFNIKVLEPSVDDFKRLQALFNLTEGGRLIPPRTKAERERYLLDKAANFANLRKSFVGLKAQPEVTISGYIPSSDKKETEDKMNERSINPGGFTDNSDFEKTLPLNTEKLRIPKQTSTTSPTKNVRLEEDIVIDDATVITNSEFAEYCNLLYQNKSNFS